MGERFLACQNRMFSVARRESYGNHRTPLFPQRLTLSIGTFHLVKGLDRAVARTRRKPRLTRPAITNVEIILRLLSRWCFAIDGRTAVAESHARDPTSTVRLRLRTLEREAKPSDRELVAGSEWARPGTMETAPQDCLSVSGRGEAHGPHHGKMKFACAMEYIAME